MKKYWIIFAFLGWSLAAMAQHDDSLTAAASAQPQKQTPATPADGLSNDQLWDRGNTAYINADYHEAIDTYNEILNRGVASMKLYYNLANAYFKENNVGKAILFYNRALRLSPGNDDIRYNLEVAQTLTKDNIETIPEFFFVTWMRNLRHTMGCTTWSLISLAALALTLTLFLFYLLAQRLWLRKIGFYGTFIAFMLCIVTTSFAIIERGEILENNEAVIMTASIPVKSSPDNSSTDLFVLHEGTTVVVTARMDNWCEIMIADGKKGWVEKGKIEII
ncbi:MAG: tetratricopeptide repeat protein [Alistipes sp.]